MNTFPTPITPAFHVTPTTGLDSKCELLFSSRMIAEKTGKLHKNVMADCRKLFEKLFLEPAAFSARYIDRKGEERLEYLLPERYLMNVLLGYSIELRDAVITEVYRLKEENQQLREQAPALPNFSDPVAAARAWADEMEQKQIAQAKLTEAQPKLEYHDKVLSADNGMPISIIAKELGMTPQCLNTRLYELGIQYPRLNRQGKKKGWLLYDEYAGQGLTTTRTRVWGENQTYTSHQLEWTERGGGLFTCSSKSVASNQ